MVQPAVRFTRADYDRIPEGMHVELIDGELLKLAEPTVRHQEIVRHLGFLFAARVGEKRILFGPVSFAIDEHNALVPDVLVMREAEIPAKDAKDIECAQVVVEVLSPSTALRDRNVKVAKYLAQGVSEVWLVDPKAETVEIHTASGTSTAHGPQTITSAALPGLAAAAVFER